MKDNKVFRILREDDKESEEKKDSLSKRIDELEADTKNSSDNYINMRKIRLFVLLAVFAAVICCAQYVFSKNDNADTNVPEVDAPETQYSEAVKNIFAKSAKVLAVYEDIYKQAVNDKSIDTSSVQSAIIDTVGNNGYVVNDYKNKISMANWETVELFIKNVDDKKDDTLTIFRILSDGGFARFDFNTSNGKVDVIRTSSKWSEDGSITNLYIDEFKTGTWKYTEKGYLIFEKELPDGYDGESGHMAVRVKPIDDTYVDLCEKYVEIFGYEFNNLFITDWTEADFSPISFMDLYENIYYQKNGDKTIEEETLDIPSTEFEEDIMRFFSITPDVLRAQEQYDETSDCYLWKQRTVLEMSGCNVPYPEVIDYTKNDDGTITLMVDAVWPEENTDKAFSHELVVRILDNGLFQYVSNHVLESDDNILAPYIDRPLR